MKNDNIQYLAALEFATKKHSGQFRIGGDEYITHPIAVAQYVQNWGYGIEYQITALFHDLLEDTDATEDEIEKIGGKEVLNAVKLLTKSENYVMKEYVEAIEKNKMARVVKSADRLHNLRCAIVTDSDFKRRYILETIDWYLGFSSEIPKAVSKLVKTLDKPLTELPFLYEPIETWSINNINNDIKGE